MLTDSAPWRETALQPDGRAVEFFLPLLIPESRELLPRAGETMTTLTDRRNDIRVNVRCP